MQRPPRNSHSCGKGHADMPTELTLADFAERVAPSKTKVRRRMRSILSDNTKVSPSLAAQIERATVALIPKYWAMYMTRYQVDAKTFLSPLSPLLALYD